MRRLGLIAGLLAPLIIGMGGLVLPGCGNNEERPDILCTTTVVADVVRQVAGDHLTVGVLLRAGMDPHKYDPTPADARRLRDAKVIFYSGLHLEGKMIELLQDLGRKKPVYALAEKLDPIRLIRDDDDNVDPHVWFDLELWADTADVVADALADFDPANAEDYRANAKSCKQRLLALHAQVKEDLAAIPKEQRVLVTAHDAFSYFGQAYDVEVHPIQGISTEHQAGLSEINKLVDLITQRKIKAIFVETSVPDRNVRALQEGCARKKHKVAIGGELYSDSLGEPGSPTGTLEGAMRQNVKTIVKALTRK